ncbi:MAG: hypothetical protein Q7S35_13335, partial [Candidatus Limnocylindrales bacterium]|nr:hypothetical protein [Candidatus Limnocylindrales bacterium]
MTVAALIPVPAFANHSDDPTSAPNAESHEIVAGNPTCGNDQFYQFKINGTPVNGTTPDGVIDIDNATPFSFDWAINDAFLDDFDIAAVIVKGGDNAIVYIYGQDTDDDDTNLQSPFNNGEQQAQISHVEFCFNEKGEPGPPPT